MEKDQDTAISCLATPEQHHQKTNSVSVKEFPIPFTDEEIDKIGKGKYDQKFALLVDTAENKGKFFVLDVTTDEYEVGDDLILLTEHAQKRNPHTKFYLARIGYDYIDRFSG